MPAFAAPQQWVTPQVICVNSPWASLEGFIAANTQTTGVQTGNAANQAVFVPFVVTTPRTFQRGFWINGTVPANLGNVSIGIYDEAGNRLATTGNVAAAGASVLQGAAFAAAVTLGPGRYYMAFESTGASGATAVTGYASNAAERRSGLYTQAVGANPLPATATFATWTTGIVVPVFGISSTSFAL